MATVLHVLDINFAGVLSLQQATATILTLMVHIVLWEQ